MEKAFYDAETPEEAIAIYFRGHDNLYDRTKEKVIEDALLSTIRFWDSLKILEVGPGGGIWTEFFIKQGADVTCVDLCEQILKGNKKLHPKAKFILGDATTVTLNEKFDLIFAKDIIEHIEDDISFLENMNRHLRTGGTLFINTQNSFSLNYLVEGSWNFLIGNKKWCGWDPTHVRFYTSKSLKEKLEMTGFETTKWFGSYYFPYRFLSLFILNKLVEHKSFHFIEMLRLYDRFPFNVMGWNIGAVGVKVGPYNEETPI